MGELRAMYFTSAGNYNNDKITYIPLVDENRPESK